MATFLYKTRGNSNPQGKPRVYFTCHSEDFPKYFEKICEDIFATHDCAIYYTEDMNEVILDEDKPTDLGQMNLFVVPVTFKLLIEPNRAMDDDIAYAKSQNIPILPLMMEPGIDAVYSRPDKFGERQYLNPYSNDLTEISYEEKLKKYLESVLISDEMAKRVRAAFDAYIFLSYRKKDRRYANQLMRLIHNIPEYRDIAIWYDEFLSPGESFQQNIEKALKESKFFTLLVTPNLLEDNNFVMTEEYPAAKRAAMPILPAEMEKTDKDELCKKYEDIPECVDPNEDEAFRARLAESLSRIAVSENNDDPEHNFLIGLAYLDGIDVETDKERGLKLITFAAESGLLEAMEKLYHMHYNGQGVRVDYNEALKWAERIWEYCRENCGEDHPATLISLSNLALTYNAIGDYKKALDLNEKCYALRCKLLGEKHPDTLISLGNLASTYNNLGIYKKALELNEKVYDLYCVIFGEEDTCTLRALGAIAITCANLGKYKRALKLNKKVYVLRCRVLGEEHPDTLLSLGNISAMYDEMGDYKKALKLNKKVYTLRCKILGEEHLDTLRTLNNLSGTYGHLGKHKKALKLKMKAYDLFCKILGEEHPDTLMLLSNLAVNYDALGDYKKARALDEKAYMLRCKIFGKEHPDTLVSLNNLAVTYGHLGKHKKALKLKMKVYDLFCKNFGEEHPYTLISLNSLAVTYYDMDEYEKANEVLEKLYALQCKVFGESDEQTLTTKENLEILRAKLGS